MTTDGVNLARSPPMPNEFLQSSNIRVVESLSRSPELSLQWVINTGMRFKTFFCSQAKLPVFYPLALLSILTTFFSNLSQTSELAIINYIRLIFAVCVWSMIDIDLYVALFRMILLFLHSNLRHWKQLNNANLFDVKMKINWSLNKRDFSVFNKTIFVFKFINVRCEDK